MNSEVFFGLFDLQHQLLVLTLYVHSLRLKVLRFRFQQRDFFTRLFSFGLSGGRVCAIIVAPPVDRFPHPFF